MTLAEQRQNLGKLSLDELADWMASVTMNSQNDQMVRAEFLRRQTLAAEDTAGYTKTNARYMLWSVIALAASSLIALIITIFK
jgi:2-phosphoglycerate kinase